jgi:hypothetical protein
MTLPTYTVPTANSATSTEEPKIITALTEIKAILSAGLHDNNFASDAQLSYSRLADGTPGAFLLANASGDIVGQAFSGDITVTSGGVATIGADKITQTKMADNSIGAAEIIADAVGTSEIAADAVGSSEIAADAVATSEIGSLAGARVYRTASQATSGGSLTMNFPSERYDVGGCHDNVTNNTRLTAPVAGVYALSASVGVEDVFAAGSFTVALQHSSVGTIAAQSLRPSADAAYIGTPAILDDIQEESICTVSTIFKMGAGEWVTVFITENFAGGASDCIGEASMALLGKG